MVNLSSSRSSCKLYQLSCSIFSACKGLVINNKIISIFFIRIYFSFLIITFDSWIHIISPLNIYIKLGKALVVKLVDTKDLKSIVKACAAPASQKIDSCRLGLSYSKTSKQNVRNTYWSIKSRWWNILINCCPKMK